MTYARLTLVAVAVLACAWFALGIRQAHDLARASSIITNTGSLSPGQVTRAQALLRGAATLSPDSQVDLLRGRLALRTGERARATQLFVAVAEREPMNVVAWFMLAQAPQSYRAWRFALARIAQLEPKLPAP